jgi:phage gp36-like protein
LATAWLTEDELKARYGAARIEGFADRDNDNLPDTGVVEGAILDAEDLARAKLAAAYGVDVLPASAAAASRAFKQALAGLALFNLESGKQDVISAFTEREHTRATAWLTSAAAGGVSLLLEGSPAVGDFRSAVVTSVRSADHVDQPITLEAMKDWM